MSKTTPIKRIENWFAGYDWTPFEFQREAWSAYLNGEHAMVHAPTGMGKTYSAWLGPVLEWLKENPDEKKWPEAVHSTRVLWITPLRALATDTAESLLSPIRELNIPWTVEKRTGDTSSSQKARQKEKPPTALVTTPESLSLLLSQAETRKRFADLRCVVVDEWHELLGTKRGVQTELCLARLREWLPKLRTFGLSATLGNLDVALDVLLGPNAKGHLIRGYFNKQIEVTTLLPDETERLPWGGHLGVKLLPQVIAAIEERQSTLLFTNTRSQAELWFNSLAEAKPGWANVIGLHHGSLDREVRNQVEDGLRSGQLKCVVCTSSLDLGVDFSPVDLVMQVGSPKGIARLLQRAGRSGHQPGALSRIICIPTNAFELIEFSAGRAAADERRVESRVPLERSLDVLVQHLVTVGVGGGFVSEELLREVRTTHAYQNLTDIEWGWALDFVTRGGSALRAYPQYHRLEEKNGVYKATTEKIIKAHRLSIGTITADMAVTIKFQGGGALGSVEESFISRIKPGENFLFAGKPLELVRIKDLTAIVKLSAKRVANVPRWMGGRMPLSTLLAQAVRRRLQGAKRGEYPDVEMQMARPVLEAQTALSRIPDVDELLIENVRTRDGYHVFLFPFAGRVVHEGLAPLLCWRIGKITPRTISTNMNDYGIELTATKPLRFTEEQWRTLLSTENLLEDLLGCLNGHEMARRRFRDIARIAGLITQGFPGNPRSARQLQVSTGLLFEVFTQFDPENLLLDQARREVLEHQLEISRLREALEKIAAERIALLDLKYLSPLSFPLWAGIFRERLSTESWIDRVQNMVESLEKAVKEGGVGANAAN